MEKGKKLLPIPLRRFHQSGHSHYWKDKKRIALVPGKRVSKNGKIYYEYRKDRSDLAPSNISYERGDKEFESL